MHELGWSQLAASLKAASDDSLLAPHGALSPTKAQQLVLIPGFDDGIVVLHKLFRSLLAACGGSGEVIDV
jgi:hypothetical protein